MSSTGILLVSHVKELGEGLGKLLHEVANDVPIFIAAGLEEGGIGTSFDQVQKAIETFEGDVLLAFYDLGSAKMNLEMVKDFSEHTLNIYDVAFIEGAYTAASLLQVGSKLEVIEKQLQELKLNK